MCLKHLPSASSQPNARYNSDTVPWQRVINSKGVISPRWDCADYTAQRRYLLTRSRGANGAARHEDVLAQEGVQVEHGSLGERSVDFRVYGWFPDRLPSRAAESDDEDERLFVES